MLVVLSAGSSQGSFGMRSSSFLCLRGMVIYNLKMSFCMHIQAPLHILNASKPNRWANAPETVGDHVVTQHFLTAKKLTFKSHEATAPLWKNPYHWAWSWKASFATADQVHSEQWSISKAIPTWICWDFCSIPTYPLLFASLNPGKTLPWNQLSLLIWEPYSLKASTAGAGWSAQAKTYTIYFYALSFVWCLWCSYTNPFHVK